MAKQLTIGLFGFGVVGEGIYEVLKNNPNLKASIKKVCIKQADKKRNAPAELFTTNYNELLFDNDINVIVELIDDADEAYKIVTTALINKKAVVSANKMLIANYLEELLLLQKEHNVPFLYEGSVCGSIPVIRNLEEYYDNDLLQSVCGIVNGSTNFILTKILKENLDYNTALKQAQELGFAESNPTLDVEGTDAVNKLTILLLHSYGIKSHPEKLLHKGISNISKKDAAFAAQRNWQIKLTAQAKKLSSGKVAAFVLPQFVTAESQLYNVQNEYNGVVIQSALSDKQFLYGKGAGRYPTASAVLSDISALRYDYKYEYRKLTSYTKAEISNDYYLKIYVRSEKLIDKTKFEYITEINTTATSEYITGVIHINNLVNADWLHSENVSIILCPDGVIETISADTKLIEDILNAPVFAAFAEVLN